MTNFKLIMLVIWSVYFGYSMSRGRSMAMGFCFMWMLFNLVWLLKQGN